MSLYIYPNIFSRREFTDNKYLKWYKQIIQKAQSEYREKSAESYYENHHILPRSMYPEHINQPWNQVLLTAREHFLVHWLLIKFTKGKQKFSAVCGFSSFNRSKSPKRKYTSHQYEMIRKNVSRCLKERYRDKTKHPCYGRVVSESHKESLRKVMTGRIVSEETRKKIGEKSKGRGKGVLKSKEHREKISQANKGKVTSEETRRKLSEINKGKGNPQYLKHGAGKDNCRFQGYYITPFGTFESIQQIMNNVPNIKYSVIRKCKDHNQIISRYAYNASSFLKLYFDKSIIGKTYKDIGFYFVYVKK